jgi:hypothetical protein
VDLWCAAAADLSMHGCLLLDMPVIKEVVAWYNTACR